MGDVIETVIDNPKSLVSKEALIGSVAEPFGLGPTGMLIGAGKNAKDEAKLKADEEAEAAAKAEAEAKAKAEADAKAAADEAAQEDARRLAELRLARRMRSLSNDTDAEAARLRLG